jgi:hypothetical protein
MVRKSEKMWRIWARALGDKPYRSKRHSDQVAFVRTCIFLSYLATNVFIVAGVIRHWGNPRPIPNAVSGTVECSPSVQSVGVPGE